LFLEGVLGKRDFFGWFFVVKLWWFCGASVVFGRWVFWAEKISLFENIFVEKAWVGEEGQAKEKTNSRFLHFAALRSE
jgi:hypothetical protein